MTPPTPSPKPRRVPPHLVVLTVLVAAMAVVLVVVTATGIGRHSTSSPAVISGATSGGALPPGLAGTAAPTFSLADATGGRLSSARLRGRPYAVTFLYTHCPDVCPLIGDELRQGLAQLGGQARRVAVVALTVDPAHDTPAAVRSWLRLHREPANFHYLIGSERQLRPVWSAFHAAPQIPGDPNSAHSAAVWFVDATGHVQALVQAGTPVKPTTFADHFRALLSDA